jgi:predicted AAA+ superfamily ATPase
MSHAQRLVVLDEVQRLPGLFAVLRGVIDQRRRAGEQAGQFLLLGSASGALLGQASESLAGRIATLELTPFQARELIRVDAVVSERDVAYNRLWCVVASRCRGWLLATRPVCAGAMPLSAPIWSATFRPWVRAFPATTLRRLWTMLAHHQGQLLNQAQLAAALAVSGQSVARYIDLLCDLMLVRRLPAWSGNVGKRLVRAPKVYVRDSGLVHALLGLRDLGSVLAPPHRRGELGGGWCWSNCWPPRRRHRPAFTAPPTVLRPTWC